MSDIVAELGSWLDAEGRIPAALGYRARDEIMALRATRDKLTWEIIDHAPQRDELAAAVAAQARNDALAAQARDEALEEAARIAEKYHPQSRIAAAIRALKLK